MSEFTHRTVTFTVSVDETGRQTLSPSVPQDGGVQGDSLVTDVVFQFPAGSVFAQNPVFVECLTPDGTYDKTQPLTKTNNAVTVPVPLRWTQYGGLTVLRLVAEDSENHVVGYSLPAQLMMNDRTEAPLSDTLIRTFIQGLCDQAEAAADASQEFAQTAGVSATASQTASATAQTASATAQSASVVAQSASASASASATAAQTAAASAAAVASYPPIIGENGNWYCWNASTGVYEDTAKPSAGEDGVSIVTATVSENGHLIVTFSDGTTADAGVCKGSKGDNGPNKIDGNTQVDLTGLLKGDGTAVSVATAGTDYETPSNKTAFFSSQSTDTQYPSAKAVSCIATVEDQRLLAKESHFNRGYLDGNGQYVASPNANFWTSDFVEVEEGQCYRLDFEGYLNDVRTTTPRKIAAYDEQEAYVDGVSFGDLGNMEIPAGVNYIRVNYTATTVTVLDLYPKATGKTTTTLCEDVVFERLDGDEAQLDTHTAQMASHADQIASHTAQITAVQSKTDYLTQQNNPVVADKDTTTWMLGYLDGNGNFVPGSNERMVTSDYIFLPRGVYNIEILGQDGGTTKTTARASALYDRNKTFSESAHNRWTNLNVSADSYLRVNYLMDSLTSFYVYDATRGKPVYVSTSHAVQDEVKDVANRLILSNEKCSYAKGRTPLVAFVLDGDWDLNEDMEEIFSAHGVRCGFAPQYDTKFTNNSLATYRAWQSKGHEILAHGSFNLNDQSTIPEATGKKYIRDAYNTLTHLGFTVRGYIGSGGKVADKYIPTIKRFFQWGATEYNGGGTSTATYTFGTTMPYHLWRYSMQQSTLAQMEAAVDTAIAGNTVVMFFGHADSGRDRGYFTAENLDALLTYIESKDIDVVTPSVAVKDFFSFRYEELLALPNVG